MLELIENDEDVLGEFIIAEEVLLGLLIVVVDGATDTEREDVALIVDGFWEVEGDG